MWQLAGVLFPQRSPDAAPIFTPPVSTSTPRHTQSGYGMPIKSSTCLDEAVAADMENLRFGFNSGCTHMYSHAWATPPFEGPRQNPKVRLLLCNIKLNDSIHEGLRTKLLLAFCSSFIFESKLSPLWLIISCMLVFYPCE